MRHSEDAVEVGWGQSYGFDNLPPMPGDGLIDESTGEAGGAAFGATAGQAQAESRGKASPGVGPVWDALASARASVESVRDELDRLAVAEFAEVAEATNELSTLVQSVHLAAIAAVGRHGSVPPGSPTATDWLATSHRWTGGRAKAVVRAASWLDEHALTAEAFHAGQFSVDHLLALRATVQANAARKAAFPEFEIRLLALAAHANMHQWRTALRGWADAVDATSGDDDAADDYRNRRGVYLSPVGDGWDLRGWLPGPEGAELAGIVNEYINRAHRNESEGSDDSSAGSPASKRADAFLDMARAAQAADLNDGARQRAAVTILIPAHHLPNNGNEEAAAPGEAAPGAAASTAESEASDCATDEQGVSVGAGSDAAAEAEAGSDAAASDLADVTPMKLALADLLQHARLLSCTWKCSNGPGSGFLAKAEAAWLSCDANIRRLVIDPDSKPLDIGRSTRVVPHWIRHSVAIRDNGCVIPGCTRPEGWCEAHHVKHWADSGDTSVENLALLCVRHHKELHLGMWKIDMSTGVPKVTHIPTSHRRKTRRTGLDVPDG